MPTLTDEEENYISLRILIGDSQQNSNIGDGVLPREGINPTYNIVDWLRAWNISERCAEVKDVSPIGQTLNFSRRIKIGTDKTELIDYVKAVLVNKRVEIKGEKGPISQTFG